MTKTNEELEREANSLTGHLTELRTRLVRSFWAIFIGMILCYNFTDQIFNWIRMPIAPYLPSGGLIFTAPMDKFIAHLKIAFFGGMVITTPIWLYQIWKFVAPGLYDKEKKYAAGFIFSGSFLFILGNAFAYFVAFPAAFHFLMTYGGDVDKPMITIDHYLSFVVTTALMFGLSFELPLILVLLGMMGIIDQRFLREKRRYAVVVLAGVSAVITPPDLLSMVMMLLPMVLLYELGVLMVGFFERKKSEELAPGAKS